MFKKTLFIMGLLASTASYADAYVDAQSICVNQTPPFKEHTIDLNDYNAIKNAVFAKKGSDYAASFDELYPIPNDASVIALSKEFDANSLNLWLETYPPQSTAYINGKRFHINGAIAIILYYLPYND